MGAKEQLQDILASSQNRIREGSERRLNDFTRRGIFLSGPAIEGYVDSYLTLIGKEIMDALGVVAESRPNRKEWECIKQVSTEFVEEQWIYLSNYCISTTLLDTK